MNSRLPWLVLLGWAVLGSARADEASQTPQAQTPRLMPSQDVDITYRSLIDGKTVRQRVRWDAAEEMERVDVPGRAYMLIDHHNQRTDIVDAKTHSVIETVNPLAGEIADLKDAHFIRLGNELVARHDCVVWRVELPGERARELCLTEEGVLLRERQHDQTLMEAIKVRFHHVDTKVFDIPPGYKASPSGNIIPTPPYGP